MKNNILFCLLAFCFISVANSSNDDSLMVKKIFDNALSSNEAYNNLFYLCKNTRGRIGGSLAELHAIEFTYQLMKKMPFDTVYLQEVWVDGWVRGKKEKGKIISSKYGNEEIRVCALGMSVGTGFPGISAEVIEVKNIEELNKIDEKEVKGKIIFFNRKLNPTYYNTFISYGEVAGNRVWGAYEAAKKGAAAVVVRSLTFANDTFPHTGKAYHNREKELIPAFAISTADADKLSSLLKYDNKLKLYLESHCYFTDSVKVYNVIGEIRGTERPERIITIGGHLDAWDLGEGAHDDGVGCMQSIDVARIFFELGIKPKNTIRIVMFADEEINGRGGNKYASEKLMENEQHYFAFESDRGGFAPIGIEIDFDEKIIPPMMKWFSLLKNYGVVFLRKGYGGVDIYPLKKYGIPLAGLVTESQRYFYYQHSDKDVFETVNEREMQLGSATIASFIYFIDKYGY